MMFLSTLSKSVAATAMTMLFSRKLEIHLMLFISERIEGSQSRTPKKIARLATDSMTNSALTEQYYTAYMLCYAFCIFPLSALNV